MKKSKLPIILPLGDRILLDLPPRAEQNAEKIIGGIVIPQGITSGATINSIDTSHAMARVIAVGETCKVVKAGQRVVVRKPNCFIVKLDGGPEHVMIREADVVALCG